MSHHASVLLPNGNNPAAAKQPKSSSRTESGAIQTALFRCFRNGSSPLPLQHRFLPHGGNLHRYFVIVIFYLFFWQIARKIAVQKKEAEETPVFPLLHCFLTKQNFMIYFFTLFNNSSPIREVCLGQHSRRVGNLISIDGKSALLYQPASLTLAGNQFDFYE